MAVSQAARPWTPVPRAIMPAVRPVVSDGPAERIDPGSLLIANSAAMRAVLEQIRRFGTCDLPVLVTGEAGTGKRLVARAIRAGSVRHSAPLVVAHCGVSAELAIEVELFGCERGFQPGLDRRHGVFERAAGGTAFLEDIEWLPANAQARLLRLLEAGEVTRPGGREPINVDLRLITAVTVGQSEAVAAPALRPDLYYRLSTLRLHVPPLRQRIADIEPLAMHLLSQIAGRLGRPVLGFTSEAMTALCGHTWPGNVRELIAVIQRAVVLGQGPHIDRRDLSLQEPGEMPGTAPVPRRPEPGSAGELSLLLETLKRVRFNITRAARELQVSRVTLYRMLQRNGLELRHDAVMRAGSPRAREAK
ncbi:MAG TPA: sigma-54 dependent transcriptional regulator, partial [Acetobacteraceae bacterium]|nr:sigma-54 dependent transcriptional regulator [Acetobacteraceae bacterium]